MPWGAEAGTPRMPSLESGGRDLATGGHATAALPCGRRERRERHYWRRPLCRGPEALDKGPLTLGKGFAEGGPRQRALGEF